MTIWAATGHDRAPRRKFIAEILPVTSLAIGSPGSGGASVLPTRASDQELNYVQIISRVPPKSAQILDNDIGFPANHFGEQLAEPVRPPIPTVARKRTFWDFAFVPSVDIQVPPQMIKKTSATRIASWRRAQRFPMAL
jgi:hypothetical protein